MRMENMELMISVAGWTNPRLVIVDDGHVSMEIARVSCANCATCRERLMDAWLTLGSRGVKHARKQVDGGIFYTLKLPSELVSKEQITCYLALCLGLQISVAG